MRVYDTHGNQELAKGIARHFLDALSYSGHEHWLVSPWIKDVRLPVGQLGHFASVLGGHHEEITLSDLLRRVAERNTLHLVTKPPEELFDLRTFSALHAKLAQYDKLKEAHASEESDLLAMVASTLPLEIDQLIRDLRTHEATYMFGQELLKDGADVRYLPRLHAKVAWSPSSAFIGSANYTNGGLYRNEELVLEVTDGKAHQGIHDQVRAMTERAVPHAQYDLKKALRRSGFDDEIAFLTLADDPLFAEHPDVQRLMERLSYLVR